MHIKDTLRKYGNEIFVSGVIVLAGLTGLGIHAYRQHQREVEKRDNPIVYQIKEDRWQIKILERRNEYLITGEQTQLPYPLNIPLIINKELTNGEFVAELVPGASATVTLTKTGTWGYHDHLRPSTIGSVVIE